MATCTDCVHFEVCISYLREAYKRAHLASPDLNSLRSLRCDDCEHFKDRSRFVELPVKPGEKVYYFDTAGRIYKSTVTRLVYGTTKLLIDSDVMFDSNLIGERFFLTREEAEQTLKEREETSGDSPGGEG